VLEEGNALQVYQNSTDTAMKEDVKLNIVAFNDTNDSNFTRRANRWKSTSLSPAKYDIEEVDGKNKLVNRTDCDCGCQILHGSYEVNRTSLEIPDSDSDSYNFYLINGTQLLDGSSQQQFDTITVTSHAYRVGYGIVDQ